MYPFILTALALALGSPGLLHAQQATAGKGAPAATEQHAARFAISLNGGLTFSYTDVKPSGHGVVLGLGATYFALPCLHINLDVQKGWLKSGDVSAASGIMGSENSFFSAGITGRFLPLTLIRNKDNNPVLKVLSGIYGGTGIGLISSSVKANQIIPSEFGSLGSYSGLALMIPVEAGISIPLAQLAGNKTIGLNLNYRANLCMSDKIDGYVPIVSANKKNDAYNTLTAGVLLHF